MPLKLIVTKDGSHSIEGADGITYHSTFGALQESRHIFINTGLRAFVGPNPAAASEQAPATAAEPNQATTARAVEPAPPRESPTPISIFEMGLGTGLNALLTAIEAADIGRPIVYETVETTPLPTEIVKELNYCRLLGQPQWQPFFEQLHTAQWDKTIPLNENFTFYKSRSDGKDYVLRQPADLVYYDAFDPAVTPELWTPQVFETLYSKLNPGAILVTYCCKGAVQRALRSAGFITEKLPGPPGKREILRASKPIKQTYS